MTAITVTCPDGVVRHDEPFATRREAEQWAEWGHCCARPHTFTQDETPD